MTTSAILLPAEQSAELLGISLSLFHKKRRTDPTFPLPIEPGPRAVRWHRDDLEEYVRSLPMSARRAEPAELQRARAARTPGSEA